MSTGEPERLFFIFLNKKAQNSAQGLDAGVKTVLTQILFHPSLMNNLK